ncbi:probable cytochrome P450 305a1 isoform X2 [Nilaparvata lugens]|uniref:Cytochrome P450 CYP305A13v2-2 n=1 Tax=Nilaparvata lugens TaxID=108931 RepID=A0A0K0LB87_NILLU|nr:probable cytochrome P450 305a1 isoform X2 [Nilaparvata lugens]AIW79975.1 cytochrome P450 CYP305A13v2-2 [Nilaparvata lugens]
MCLELFYLLIGFITSFCCILLNSCRRPTNYPPGPKWLPFVGNTPLLKKLSRKLGGQHNALSYLAEKYNSNIIGLKLGSQLFVVVNSESLIKQVFARNEFQARPDNFFIRLRSMGERKGITMTDGPLWQEQRLFALLHLRDLGFGKQAMEKLILDELEMLCKLGSGGAVVWNAVLAPSVLNVLWTLAAGTPFGDEQDATLTSLLRLMDERSRAFDMAGGVLSQLPWLRHVAPELTGFTLIQNLNTQLSQLLKDTIHMHKKTLQEGVVRDFIDVFLHQMSVTNGGPTTFTEDQLIMVCLDFFIAGSQTTSNTLNFALINMVLHPEICKKAQDEIDHVLGDRKISAMADKNRLPYTEAVLLESQRYQHVVPISGPRRVLTDTKLEDYHIPEGTTVLINVRDVHHNSEKWEIPEVFRPERFLDSDGKFCPQELYLFSCGKRRCLGEPLAKNFVFLFFVSILKNYTMSPSPGEPTPTLDPTPGITLSPKANCILLNPR